MRCQSPVSRGEGAHSLAKMRPGQKWHCLTALFLHTAFSIKWPIVAFPSFFFSYAFSLPLSLSLSLAILFFFPLSFGYSSPSRFNSLLARNIDSQPLLAKFGFIAFYLASICTSFGNEISFHLFFPSFLSFLACLPVDNNIYIYFYLRNYYFFFDFMRREEALPSFLLRVKKYSASRFN